MINRQTMMKFFLISLFLIGIGYSQLEAKYDFKTVGEITAITDSSITMNDTQFEVNSLTTVFTENGISINYSTLATGDRVKIMGVILNNIKIANVITLLEDADSSDKSEIEAKGTITALSTTSLTVDGKTFTFKSDTKVYLEGQGLVDLTYLQLGQKVEVNGYVSNDTTFANWIKIENEDHGDMTEIEIKGTITALADGSVTVNSTLFYLQTDTKIMLKDSGQVDFSYLAIGMEVEVKGFSSGDSNIAEMINIERKDDGDSEDNYKELEVKGEIKALTLTSVTVDTTEFQINVNTKVILEGKGVMSLTDLKVGQMVEVSGYISGDSNIARVIKIEKESIEDTNKVEKELHGTITALSDSTMTVDSTTFRFTPDTRVFMKGIAAISDLKVGQKVEVRGYSENNENYALFIKIELEADKGIDLEVEGIITSLSSTELKIDSLSFELNSQTLVVLAGKGKVSLDELAIGQTVEVKAYLSDSVYIAKIIKIKDYTDYKYLTVFGEVTAKDSSSMTVNDTKFLITPETEFYGKNGAVLTFMDFDLGMMVKIKAIVQDSVSTALRIYLITPDSIEQDEQKINLVEENTLVVGSQIYMVNPSTEVYDNKGFLVSYFELNEGMDVNVVENLVAGRLFASKIQILAITTGLETMDIGTVQFTNYPNPFSDHTVLSFNLNGTANVSLEIFDRLGAKVMDLYNGELNAGVHNFDLNINGSSIADGVYFAKLRINGNVIVNKLIKQ